MAQACMLHVLIKNYKFCISINISNLNTLLTQYGCKHCDTCCFSKRTVNFVFTGVEKRGESELIV